MYVKQTPTASAKARWPICFSCRNCLIRWPNFMRSILLLTDTCQRKLLGVNSQRFAGKPAAADFAAVSLAWGNSRMLSGRRPGWTPLLTRSDEGNSSANANPERAGAGADAEPDRA